MDQPTPPPIPPIQPGPMVSAKPASNWPTVIGIIAMVFGGLGILGGAWGVVGSLMPGLLHFAAGPENRMFEVMSKWTTWNVAMSIITITVAALLLTAGIKLLKRRPDAPGWCRTWAVVKILLVLVVGIVNYFYQQDLYAAMEDTQGPGGRPAMAFPVMKAVAAASVAFSLLWGWALPVFMLIWFGRQKIKAETADWRNSRATFGTGF